MRKQYTPEMKAQIVLEILKEEKSISELASEHDMHPNQLSRWKREALENFHQLFTDGNKDTKKMKTEYESKINELYSDVGRLTTQVNWLKKKSGIKVE
jgi:putative transposase